MEVQYAINVLGLNQFSVDLQFNGSYYSTEMGTLSNNLVANNGFITPLISGSLIYSNNFDMCSLNYNSSNNVSRDFSFNQVAINPSSGNLSIILPSLDPAKWQPTCGIDNDLDNDTVLNDDEDLNGNGNLDDDDTDGDEIPNYLDNDDDGDGILSINEDLNADGDITNDNFDGDDFPNYLDPDDDNDTVLTIDEYFNNQDFDGDGQPNYLDIDDDNDTVLTEFENPLSPSDSGYVYTGILDTDTDGSPNYLDIDDDGDGYITQEEDENGNSNPVDDDTDADGHPDFLDPADNDPSIPGMISQSNFVNIVGDKRY